MSEPKKDYWFPAKKLGWGWGFPVVWQGWVAFAAYLVLATGGAFLLTHRMILFLAFQVVIAAALFAVCWLKGERPGRVPLSSGSVGEPREH